MEAGIQLRKAIQRVDFGLQDSFCDSQDLQDSWENTMMPESLLTFFSALFHIPKHKLFKTKARDLDDMINLEPSDSESESEEIDHEDTITDELTENVIWEKDQIST